MPVQMLNDFILVKEIEEKSSDSDLIMIDSSSSSCKRMRVISCVGTLPIEDDIIFVPKSAHMQQITVDGELLFCVRRQEIIGIEKREQNL
jgi:co-chaperonin GroES (HSP10)